MLDREVGVGVGVGVGGGVSFRFLSKIVHDNPLSAVLALILACSLFVNVGHGSGWNDI